MPIAAPTADELTVLQDEAVRFTRELIRIDTTNFGGTTPPPGARARGRPRSMWWSCCARWASSRR